jgi:hypothetical protein
MGDVERHRPATGFLGQFRQILGGARDGIDVDPAAVAAPMPRLAPVTMAVR